MRGLCYFYLSILTQVSSSTFKVIGLVGHDVTLPCRYDSQTHGSLSFCWGRGMVPRSKCSSTILSSEVGAVQSRRYQLLGNVTDGDVSLTILDAQWSDAGMYGCRLEIPGWFNDKKFNTRLVMEEAPVEEPVTLDWTFTVGGTQVLTEILTEFATSAKNVEVGEPTLDMMRIAATEEKLKAFLEVENIGRMAGIFLLAIILILVSVFWRSFLPQRTLQHLNISTAENIYEVL
ncbi:T-cell immunoglobulin and mucin domain-containing protein 4-like isoform X2 [Cottoperca gobio]|uniref:T-cell immunoglobulin and mucin domain-containing protein 4-like isoform X2 n=1 Tax=Cottoperca gobio TaxID=56716 RepID=UPI00110E897F|nr:T-cell immunoglobulin and mucin domain-containing protein 4-like isoform X2 [Cottoperca gobio]